MRIRQLYQNDLPAMYQRCGCMNDDLQQRTGGDNDGNFINKPHVFLANILMLIVIIVLLN